MPVERFDRYVERRLYGPDGFYTSGGRAGRRRGDFLTSPEVGPVFGEVLVNACYRWWCDLGQPEPFTVVDLGTGPGTLLRSMDLAVRSRPYGDGWRLLGVDRAGPHADVDLPDDLSAAVVIGNELLDNVPFRVLQTGPGGPCELYVGGDGEVLDPVASDDPAVQRVMGLSGVGALAPGTRLPLLAGASELVDTVLARQPGRMCLIDYGAKTTVSLARRGGWLRGYRGHTRIDDVLRSDVAFDITTDIAIDQLPGRPSIVTQAEFMADNGLDELVAEGRRYWRDNAAAPDLTALRMRSRGTEAEALTDPVGLGSWLVALW